MYCSHEGLCDSDEDDEDDLIVLKADDCLPPIASLAYDILYRPLDLEDLCMWDIMCQFEKCTKKKAKDLYANEPEVEDGRTSMSRFVFGSFLFKN